MKNLSKPQQTIYDMSKVIGGSISAICGSMLKEGTPDIDLLKKSVNELYRLNDALRIRIKEIDGQPMQYVKDYSETDIEVLQFESETAFAEYANEIARQHISLYDDLAQISVVIIKNKYGIIAKLHHIIGDAWTLTLLAQQYNELINGNTPKAYSYIDYLGAENQYINSNRYENDKKYWLNIFNQCDEVTYLNEKEIKTYKSNRKTYIVDKNSTAKIQKYTNENGASVYSLFMTLFAVYMNRIKFNCEKFYIGTAVLNRTGLKEKNTMGMYINTVPLLIDISNNDTFADCIEKISDNSSTMFRHQKYNYMDILKDIREKYSFNEMLYDVIFSYQNAKVISSDYNFTTEWYCPGMQTESLQIHIDDRDNEGILKIHYDYLTDKFTEQDIEHMHKHMFNLLYDAVNNENKKIQELNILSESEKNKLLYEFNDTKSDYPKDKCVHQLFEEQAVKTPDKTAVVACDKTLTYDELNKLSNRIANALIEKGIGKGDIVAFALPRRSYLIATMFGILKSGAAYMPIDPDYPQDRIEYMLADSGAKLFITDENITEYMSDSEENPNVKMTSDSYCYCIYTSGSTGKPKGTLLHHKGIINLVTNLGLYKDLSKCKVFGFLTTITFDVATQEILTALLNGFTGCLMPERSKSSVEEILDGIVQNKIDIIYATPSYFDTLTSTAENAGKVLSQLKVVSLAGEKFYLNNTVKGLRNEYETIFENQYGPVELHVIATATTVVDDDFTSIGRVVANDDAYIVDKYNNILPTGQVGELCIAGDGVGAGYLNRPELTAEKFINNPFGEGKLYKTGDLAYWREDGNIMFVGRNDFQVKIRGLRIELGEIENAICSTDDISQAVVVVRKDESGRQLICAFYTEKSAVDVSDIKKTILDKLPKYMLPHIFTRLDEMPLTPSGKINRKALPEVDLHIQSIVEYIAPQTENEKILISAVEDVLDTDNVSIMDNFFDIGGDSLKAIELLSKLETNGFSTTVKNIFDSDNIKTLAEKLETTENAEDIFVYDDDIPATPAQMRVYTAQNMNANSTMYNVPYVFKVNDLNIDKLQAAVDKMIERHEILRTHFENKDGQIIQIINENAACKVEQLKSDDILSFIRPFDLSSAPLIRIGCYENTVMIDMHHIITDGGSMPVFLSELNDLYMGRELNNQPVQYKQFSVEKQDYANSKNYWLSIYNDELPELEINTDFPRGQKQSFNGRAIYDTIDINLHNQITDKCKNLNITPFVFYMGAFNILLSKFSGNEDIIVGMPISGRKNKYLNTIGMFVNTIALRNKPTGSKMVSEFLNEVKENSVNAIANQDYPFGELVQELKIDVQNRNPLFDVMFAYQSEEMTDVILGDEQAELLPVLITTSKYDFTFNIMPHENDIVLMVEYCTDLYKENTINKMITGFKLILQQMLKEDSLITDICAISEQEMNKLLYEFNNTKSDYPKDKCVHQLFEEQAVKTPDKTAVIACDKTLTYDELNKLSNRIANALIEKDIGKGDIVAFALPRKSYLIATMFGILKSGAAYMPINPDYPRDRITYMLSDSKAKIFLTDNNINAYISDNEQNPNIKMISDSLCYCIYTSGSTGNPKGLLIKHRNVVNFCSKNSENKFQYRLIQNCNSIFAVNSIAFDITLQETALPLLNGLEVILISDDEIYNINKSISLLYKRDKLGLIITPTKLELYLQNKDFTKCLSKFSLIMVGAEMLKQKTVQTIQNYTNAIIINGYGPTETTCGVTYAIIKDNDINIGTPIANTQIYIADKYCKPVPIGQVGELCIAGDGVGGGYLNRPELTAEKFIDNPFGVGKMYKTGDLAYWREDGNIMFVGRNDFQVKIRGLRIELGEIENAICSTDGILQSVVVVRKDKSDRQLICAFYTEKSAVDIADIKTTILDRLPKYMLPHIFTRLDEMPLTTSGKINRKALPEVDLENISNDTEYVKPQTELQKEIARLMEQCLKYSPIGLDDDFFDCGGDSLTAIEFVSKAHNEGIYFNLQAIFDNPTVKGLCEHIENGDKSHIIYRAEDFEKYKNILSKNVIDKNFAPQKRNIGNIFVTGSTGFLGSHIIDSFISSNSDGKIYCLVRENENRLEDTLSYYFGDKYIDNDRIVPIIGTLESLANIQIDDNINLVIHTAASVKHYGSYQYFYDMNVLGTQNVIDFTKRHNAKLIHVSTLSVSGNTMADTFDAFRNEEELFFNEASLFIGQPLDNVYARSKFEAEKAVLDAMLDGLQANIIRVGNLTNRYSDCKFQPNYQENAFAKRVKAVLGFGAIPDYLLPLYTEFSPIDDTAKAIFTIAQHFNNKYTVFNCNSNKIVYFDKLIKYLRDLNIKIDIVSSEQFIQRLNTNGMEFVYEALINDMDENNKLVYDSNIRIENDFTLEYLKKLGFEWSDIDMEYIKKYINYFREIGYLEV